MTNKQIARFFDLHAKLLTLHEGNPFKIRSYQNAYNTLRQIGEDVIGLDLKSLMEIPGIGKAIANKIIEIKEKKTFQDLDDILSKTPPGVVEMMKLKGLGPKKIRLIWKGLAVESLGELDYAIDENRLTLLKGFGQKTQENIKNQIAFLKSVKGKYRIDDADIAAKELIDVLKKHFPAERFSVIGELRRYMPIVNGVDILMTISSDECHRVLKDKLEEIDGVYYFDNVKIGFVESSIEKFGSDLFVLTGPRNFTKNFDIFDSSDENEIFVSNKKNFVQPVFRDIEVGSVDFERGNYIEDKDIKGVIHNHTIWSDGSNKVLDMANYYKECGYEYMVVTDHSKSAFYANGVKLDQVKYYLDDIAKANAEIKDFTIFSGIESDILIDGSLDYEDDILQQFDVVIASIHSVLRMDKEKATNRLLKAIENPFTKILGHMTGRILLAREEYPLDYNIIFEACAKNNVVIELNANPHRLDIDWTLISKAQSMGVKLSINPDAHSKEEVHYIKYGVLIAQKGGLLKDNCLNIKPVSEFINWLQ